MVPDLDARRRWREAGGTNASILGVMLVIYIANGELMRAEAIDEVAPFMLIWFAHSMGCVLLPLLTLYDRCITVAVRKPAAEAVRPAVVPWRSLGATALALAPLYALLNWLLVRSYAANAMAFTNTVFASNSCFTFAFAAPILKVRPTPMKMCAALLSLFGVASLSWASPGRGSSSSSSSGGAALALSAAMMDALYKVLMMRYVAMAGAPGSGGGAPSPRTVLRYVGLLGAVHLVALWPLFVLLDWLHIEAFALPSASTLAVLCVIGAGSLLVATLAVWLLMRAGPIYISVGMSLAIPLGYAADMLAGTKSGEGDGDRGHGKKLVTVLGALAVCGSVLLATRAGHSPRRGGVGKVRHFYRESAASAV